MVIEFPPMFDVRINREQDRQVHAGSRLGEWNSRLLFGAWYGTTLAGGAFGVMLFFWELVVPFNYAQIDSITTVLSGICKFFVACCLGFILGAFWAGFVGLFVYLIAVFLVLALGNRQTPSWLGSFFGGWTAFCCCGGFVWVAVTVGQLGAAIVAAIMLSGRREDLSQEVRDQRSQFRLSQLFRFMTVACVCLGIVSLLPFDDQFRLQVGYCMAWQCGVALLIVAAQKLWARRST